MISLITVPAWWSVPFVLLLACIALVPLIHKRFWERCYRYFAAGLGLIVVLAYISVFGRGGCQRMAETALEYFRFIALIGSLYVVTGGILIDISGRGRPWLNTLLLLAGAVLANVIGTTGASALLIRPYLRMNKGRSRPFHVVFFIFIVSNCGGALTPIGDPPLFLGYLHGVPFTWTIAHCFPAWTLAVGSLAAVFFVMDALTSKNEFATGGPIKVQLSGAVNVFYLGWVLLGVFADKLLPAQYAHYPLGALLMLASACASYRFSAPENLARNEFSFGPLKEVAWLFLGIFVTMVPALDYLTGNAAALGVATPGGFYFASGALSSVLDNAPTYLTFLAAAHGLKGLALDPANMPEFLARHGSYVLAVSLGSVFFGACTYIGNGPNFMVKAIADSAGVETPGFLGYVFKYTLWVLLPIYVAVWLLFF
ncbi:MAG: sodium:proton antiporter [Planctomycetota bacterium]